MSGGGPRKSSSGRGTEAPRNALDDDGPDADDESTLFELLCPGPEGRCLSLELDERARGLAGVAFR